MCLFLQDDLFSASGEAEFTIRADELLKHISLLQFSSLVVSNDHSSLRMTDGDSFVQIPIVNPIEPPYIPVSAFSTTAVLEKESLKNILCGRVTYQIDKNALVVSRHTAELVETQEIQAEFLEKGYLDFHCSNDWVESARAFYDIIGTVMLCFADTVLCVRFILKDSSSAYLEIQVRALVC